MSHRRRSAVLLSFTATLAAAAAWSRSPPRRAAAPAAGAPQFGAWGVDLTGRDLTVKPGDDFERYANGHWEDITQIPPDRARWGSFDQLRERSIEDIHAILEALPADATRGSNQRKLARFYRGDSDTAAL